MVRTVVARGVERGGIRLLSIRDAVDGFINSFHPSFDATFFRDALPY
jgi:hypothetical protein